MSTAAAEHTDTEEHCNEIHVVGRLATEARERVLPSGDLLVYWYLVVARPQRGRPGGGKGRASTDSLECVARTAKVRRAALGWTPGDIIEIDGALHRRFFRGRSGAESRYEIEVSSARRVSRGS